MFKKRFNALFIIFCVTGWSSESLSLKIDRVILSADLNPMYLDFWPVVANVWRHVLGIRPTLALIAPEGTIVDTSVGDVIRFDPIPGVSVATQAQVIRLLVPAYFENDVCIISDIDMIPLCKDYFVNSVSSINEDAFVVFRDRAYGPNPSSYPMCYNVAKGKTFKEVFSIGHADDITNIIKQWVLTGYGWGTDEAMLFQYLNNWSEKSSRLVKLGHGVGPRVDRYEWHYDASRVRNGGYIDSHMVRPYNHHKGQIDALVNIIMSRQW